MKITISVTKRNFFHKFYPKCALMPISEYDLGDTGMGEGG